VYISDLLLSFQEIKIISLEKYTFLSYIRNRNNLNTSINFTEINRNTVKELFSIYTVAVYRWLQNNSSSNIYLLLFCTNLKMLYSSFYLFHNAFFHYINKYSPFLN